MASITLQVGAEYATGTTVSVYHTVNSVPLTPVGGAITSATVGSDGSITFTGLASDVTYLAYAASGSPQYVRFYMPPAAATGGGSGVILPWATATEYVTGQPVTNSGNTYTADDDHTSGATFAGDLAAHWTALPVAAGTTTVAGATDVEDATAVVDGNVLYYDGATSKFRGVAPALNLIDAKGDLIGATGQDAPVRVAVGTNGQVLTADSTQTPGIKWATPSALSLTWPSYAVGDYVTTPASATQNSALTDGRLDVAPLYVGKPFNIDQLSIRVITGVGATVIRLGIWNDNGAGRPGTLLAEASSTVDSSSSGGKTANLASALTLASGVYWLGAQAEGGGPTVVCCSNISAFAPASSPTSLGVNGWRTTHTGAFGSLVAASWSLIGGNAAPVVTARVSA